MCAVRVSYWHAAQEAVAKRMRGIRAKQTGFGSHPLSSCWATECVHPSFLYLQSYPRVLIRKALRTVLHQMLIRLKWVKRVQLWPSLVRPDWTRWSRLTLWCFETWPKNDIFAMTWSQSRAGIHWSTLVMWLVKNERVTKQCNRGRDSDSHNSARATGHHE